MMCLEMDLGVKNEIEPIEGRDCPSPIHLPPITAREAATTNHIDPNVFYFSSITYRTMVSNAFVVHFVYSLLTQNYTSSAQPAFTRNGLALGVGCGS